MEMSNFIVIGENIHCTRIIKLGGKHTVELPDGHGVAFKYQGEDRVLAIPNNWGKISPAFNDGKIKHVALAIYQVREGSGDERKTAEDYLLWAADRQIDAGAHFLDVNVDEYSNDPAERTEVMRWVVEFLSQRFEKPLSIDSSSVETLSAGLEACGKKVSSPMVNSVSLERSECIDAIVQFDAHAVVGATGREKMPSDLAERMANFDEIVSMLDTASVPREKMHLDPLVMPVSTDPMNGRILLEAISEAKNRFEGVHLTGGFSNVSFGMPHRKLLNMVFVRLCAEAGADSGIIDPVVMPVTAIAELDTESEPYRLARDFLLGDDMYGMEFIAAHRQGKLG